MYISKSELRSKLYRLYDMFCHCDFESKEDYVSFCMNYTKSLFKELEQKEILINIYNNMYNNIQPVFNGFRKKSDLIADLMKEIKEIEGIIYI